MNPSALFIQRPVTTILVMLGILLFGVMAYHRLPVSDLPNVDFPTIQVSASLAGASLKPWLLLWPRPWKRNLPPLQVLIP